MRKTRGAAGKQTPKGAGGVAVDQLLEKIRARIYDLKLQDGIFTKKGCTKAYAHFKTGTNKMYLLSPSEGGGRKFTYVGVDPKKQEEARSEIDRYEHRENVRRQIQRLCGSLEGAERELARLGESCQSIIKEDGISVWPGGRGDRFHGHFDRSPFRVTPILHRAGSHESAPDPGDP